MVMRECFYAEVHDFVKPADEVEWCLDLALLRTMTQVSDMAHNFSNYDR